MPSTFSSHNVFYIEKPYIRCDVFRKHRVMHGDQPDSPLTDADTPIAYPSPRHNLNMSQEVKKVNRTFDRGMMVKGVCHKLSFHHIKSGGKPTLHPNANLHNDLMILEEERYDITKLPCVQP